MRRLIKMEQLDKIDNFKPFGFRRNLDYIRVNFFIVFKKMLEYKSNFFFFAIEHIIYIASLSISFNIFFSQFFEIISWQLEDYILFFVLMDWISAIGGIFFWRWPFLNQLITKGDFNIFLVRPINVFWGYFFSNLNSGLLVYTIINPIIHLFILIYFFDIQIYNIFLGILIWVAVFVCQVLVSECVHSFEFLKKGSSISIYRLTDTINYGYANQYPFQLFNGVKYKGFFLIFTPMFFIGSLLIPILRGYPIWNIELQLTILFALFVICLGVLVFNWKYGLKRYEAFG